MNSMKGNNYRKSILVISIGLLFFTNNPSFLKSEELSADKIMKEYAARQRITRIENLTFISYNVLNNNKKCRLEAKYYAKTVASNGGYMRMMRFIAPASINNVGILALEHANGNDEIWIYIPAEKKSRILTESEKKSRFMDTEFTYSDIFTAKIIDFNHSILKSEKYHGADCFVICSVPKNLIDRYKTGIGKILTWINKEDFVGLKTAYYDANGRIVRTIRRSKLVEFDRINHQWMTLKSAVVNERTNMKTMMESRFISFKTRIPDAWFTIEHLEKE